MFKMVGGSGGCSGETLLVTCTRKKRLQRKMTKDYYWIVVQGNIGMFNANFIIGNASLPHQPIIYCSDNFTNATGYSKRDVLHKSVTCNFLYGKLTNKEDLKRIEGTIDGKHELQLEIILYKKNKTPAWFLLHIAPIKDDREEVVLFLLTFRDITHLKDPIEQEPLRKWSRLVKKTMDKSKAEDLNSNHMIHNPRSVFMQLTKKTNNKRAQISQMISGNSSLHVNYSWEGMKMERFIILHYSTAKTVFDWIILILTLYTAVMVPFVVCFQFQHTALTIFNTIIDCVFIMDVIMNFRTTYMNKDGELVYDSKMITYNYLKSWFIVDVTAAFPYGLINLAYKEQAGPAQIIGIIKVVRLIRLARIARKLDHYFEFGATTLILWLFLFCLCAHWMACIWYVIGFHFDKPNKKWGWLYMLSNTVHMPYEYKNGSLVKGSGPTYAASYMSALYYTMSSLTTCGFGNIAPNTTAEKLFGCITMLLGCLLYAFIFGQVTAIIQQFQRASSIYHEKLRQMRQFVKLYGVSEELSTRLIDYFMSTWQSNKGIDVEDILKSVPRDLQADLCIHLHKSVFERIPIFTNAPATVKRAIARYFWTVTTAPGDRLIYHGETLDCLYFIENGSLEVRQDRQIVGILGPSDYFGCCNIDTERGVGKSRYDVLALTYADIHCITKDSLREGLSLYPEFYEKYREKCLPTFDMSDEMNLYSRSGSMHPLREIQEKSNFWSRPEPDQGQTCTDGSASTTHTLFVHGNVPRMRRPSITFDSDPSDSEVLSGLHELKGEVSREIEIMNAKMGIVEEQISLVLRLLQGKETPRKAEVMNKKLVELQKFSAGDAPDSSDASQTDLGSQSKESPVLRGGKAAVNRPKRSETLSLDEDIDQAIEEINLDDDITTKAKDFSPIVDYRPSKLKKQSSSKEQKFEMKPTERGSGSRAEKHTSKA